MRISRITQALCLTLTLFGAAWTPLAQCGELTAAEAGKIAGQQTGGQVLAVKAADGGFQVKVLTPDGKVRYVFIPNR
ncbi:hypothetical protein G3480_05670 [Thiorhodococcus mannitoliphagus]|uniref:PepSY domain-containing protein n=1 Tax=Thiorhodococcus mannitoliphagus TaxID=329406 RepID=A0A6P1DVZ7_9GAMM|nr:hypothetical protein [Thiorhodococcus mannitoliphagus]NEX19805.1 hypothetical protein [Thiorhodococcus mannitoliphagus]